MAGVLWVRDKPLVGIYLDFTHGRAYLDEPKTGIKLERRRGIRVNVDDFDPMDWVILRKELETRGVGGDRELFWESFGVRLDIRGFMERLYNLMDIDLSQEAGGSLAAFPRLTMRRGKSWEAAAP